MSRSHRTPFKHFILNAHIGRIIGVGWTCAGSGFINLKDYPLLVVDLCAGDGLVVEGVHRSSPHILHHHCWHAMNPPGRFTPFGVDLRFIEKSPHIHADLLRSVETYEKRVEAQYILGDAREVEWRAAHESQACFINADPNHINDLPVPPDMAERLTRATTFTVTLGCNVGGLKRLDFDARQQWFGYMETLLELLQKWHDALLVKLENDASQWAYLSCVPSKWTQDEIAKISAASRKYEQPVSLASYRTQPQEFIRLRDSLFLTRREFEERYAN